MFAIVSPITFGSYGSLAKGVLDRIICLVLPHFTTDRRRGPPQAALQPLSGAPRAGHAAEPDAEQEALFARLVERNSVNLHHPEHAVAVVAGDSDPVAAQRSLLDSVSAAKGVAA